jgi:heterotetrameric sarcosine oxidase gamma subunit
VKDERLVSIFDVTHARALVRVTGPRTPDLLAKVCAIDFADGVTPNGAAFRSSVAKLVTDVVRDDRDGEISYLLHCELSSGQYLFDALIDAGDEFGIGVDGFVDPGNTGD